jgi:hypothetical protein
MEKRGELKLQKFDATADWFMLNTTQRIKDPRKYYHEQGGADLFTAYYHHLKDAGAWAYEPKVLSDRADRGMRLFDRTFYFEVDRGTETQSEIEKKLDNYTRYSRETGERFFVVFVLMDGKRTAQARGYELMPLLEARQRNNQFLIASRDRLIADPLGRLLYSPTHELYSVQNVI